VASAVEERGKQEKKTSVFHPIPETREDGKEEEDTEGKNDDNNNAEVDNMNKATKAQSSTTPDPRRSESRKVSHYDVNTILEEMDELAVRRDSSPPCSPSPRRPPHLPRSARELIQRRKSLLVHLNDWYSDLCWPYDEDETVLGLRYAISGLLTTLALAVLCSTFFG